MIPHPFEILIPNEIKSGIIVTSPHSGTFFPEDFLELTNLTIYELRASEDSFVDEFAKAAHFHGYPCLLANYSRAYLDLNRDYKILDSNIVEGIIPNKSCIYTNNGFGIIPRTTGGNTKIYNKKIAKEDAISRINNVYMPYHNAIDEYVKLAFEKHNKSLVIDVHSMPKTALGNVECDIVIGNRFGTSCNDKITQFLCDYFVRNGLKVQINSPYAGGYTTIKHGKPKIHSHAVQIEVNRSLYMNEQTFIKGDKFADFVKIFDILFSEIGSIFDNI